MTAKINRKSRSAGPLAAALVVASLAPLSAQDADGPMFRNRFGLSYRSGFNVSASFRNLGTVPAMSNPGLAQSGQNHTYDDGYVLQDSGSGGDTWNWGYQNSSQTPPPGNDVILFHSSQPLGARLDNIDGDPQHGLEFTYERWIGRAGENGNWGWAFGFNYGNFSMKTDRPTFGNASQTTDSYSLNGVVPPQPPYNGSFSGPGPLINDTPTRTMSTVPALVSGRHEIDADMFGAHIGPYVEFPANPRLNFSFSAGLALAVVNSQFRFNENVSVSGQAIGSASGSNTRCGLLYGAYAGSNLSYALNPQWTLILGAEFQTLSDFKQRSNGREAKLDFSTGVFARAGLNFSF